MRFALAASILLASTRPAEAGRGANLLKYLPDDTDVLVVADIARARRSPIWKKGWQTARDKNDWLDALASSVAVDKVVDTIVVGGDRDKAQLVVVFEGKVDKLHAELIKDSPEPSTHAGVKYWTIAHGEAALVDKKLIVTPAGAMTAAIDRAKDRKVKGPAIARTILAATTPNTTVFGGAMLEAQVKKDLTKELGAEPEWATFSLGMATRLTVDGRLKFADDDAAQKAAKLVNDRLGAPGAEGTVRGQAEAWIGKEFSDSITVDTDHVFARFAATMTADEVDKVLALVKMFM